MKEIRLSLRISTELNERIENLRNEIEQKAGGISINKSQLIEKLITSGLEVLENEKKGVWAKLK